MLVLVGIAYNNATGRSYTHPQRPQRDDRAVGAGQFSTADLDAALAHYNQVLDISRADLAGLLHMAGRAAFQRTLGELRCADIMSRPPMAVEPGVALKEAWTMMRREQIKALPVVDAQGAVLGIVTVADFVRLASLDTHEGLGQRLRTLIRGRSGRPSRVKDIMSQLSTEKLGTGLQRSHALGRCINPWRRCAATKSTFHQIYQTLLLNMPSFL